MRTMRMTSRTIRIMIHSWKGGGGREGEGGREGGRDGGKKEGGRKGRKGGRREREREREEEKMSSLNSIT